MACKLGCAMTMAGMKTSSAKPIAIAIRSARRYRPVMATPMRKAAATGTVIAEGSRTSRRPRRHRRTR